jgi:hypothetical protein
MRHLPCDNDKRLKAPRSATLKTALHKAGKFKKSTAELPAVGMEAEKARTLGAISGNPAIV